MLATEHAALVFLHPFLPQCLDLQVLLQVRGSGRFREARALQKVKNKTKWRCQGSSVQWKSNPAPRTLQSVRATSSRMLVPAVADGCASRWKSVWRRFRGNTCLVACKEVDRCRKMCARREICCQPSPQPPQWPAVCLT